MSMRGPYIIQQKPPAASRLLRWHFIGPEELNDELQEGFGVVSMHVVPGGDHVFDHCSREHLSDPRQIVGTGK